MRKRGWVVGVLLVAGAAGLVGLRTERPRSDVPPASPSVPVAAHPSRPAAPPRPSAGLRIRGTVVDTHHRPVAAVRVSASWPQPGQTLSELPCPPEGGVAPESQRQRNLSDCFDDAVDLIIELAGARQGEAPVYAEATTAADGTFTLEGLPEGPLALWALGESGAAMRSGIPSGTGGVELVLDEDGILEGTVSGEGAPLAGVRVTALSTVHTRFFDATTDAQGRYRIGPLPRGLYGLLFLKEGWLSELSLLDYLERRTKEDVTLERPRTLTGRVVSASGASAPGVQVLVGWGKQLPDSGARTVTSDAQGRFTVVLPSGPYTLTASSEGRSALARVELGAQPSPEVVLELGSGLQVSGRVLDDARQPVAGARVELRHARDDGQRREAVTDAEGRYSVGPLEPGTWGFKVEAPRHRDVEDARHALTQAMGPLDFTLARIPFVEGRLTDTAGQPLPHLRVQLVRICLEEGGVDEYQSHAYSDAEGRFVLDASAEGDHRVEVTEEEYLYEPATVHAPARDVHLTLRSGASVVGTLVDGRGLPLEAFTVMMISIDEATDERGDVTDARGRFSLRGLEPGAYRLLASQVTDGVERQVWREVELQEDARVEVELRFPEERTLSGFVVDEQGRPPPVAYVQALTPEEDKPEGLSGRGGRGMGAPRGVRTDKDGRFTLRGLTAPRYLLNASVRGYAFSPERSAGGEVREDGLLAGADSAGVRLVLERQAHVVGRVVGPDGAPLSSVVVNDRVYVTPEGRFAVPFEDSGVEGFMFSAKGMALVVRTVEPRGGADVDLGVVRLEKGRTVHGRVVDARTSRPVGDGSLRVILVERFPIPGGSRTRWRTQRIRADGTFEVDRLTARPYTLELTDAEGYHPAEVQVGAEQHEVTVRLEPLVTP
ncbi:MAG TPA: carboxypeptidase-like regulatory domain-containing protein [Myxococcus sp.]|nr:carboxypeptidase-like regulatory domain-containing protein [Myxococcus sp.]